MISESALIKQAFSEGGEDQLIDQMFQTPTSEQDLVSQMFASEPAEEADVPVVSKYPSTHPLNHNRIISKHFQSLYGQEVDPDKSFIPSPIIDEKFKDDVVETMLGYGELAKRTLEDPARQGLVRGIADIALQLPGFAMGVLGAAQQMAERVLAGNWDLEELYDAASHGMHRDMEWWYKHVNEKTIGPLTQDEHLVGMTLMAPILALHEVGQAVAKWPRFNTGKDSDPWIRGAAKFAGDLGGLVALHRLMRVDRRLTKPLEEATRKAAEIIEKEKRVDNIPNEVVREAQRKIIELEKARLAEVIKEATKDLDIDTLIKEDMYRKAEQIALEKAFPIESTGLKKPKKVYEGEIVPEVPKGAKPVGPVGDAKPVESGGWTQREGSPSKFKRLGEEKGKDSVGEFTVEYTLIDDGAGWGFRIRRRFTDKDGTETSELVQRRNGDQVWQKSDVLDSRVEQVKYKTEKEALDAIKSDKSDLGIKEGAKPAEPVWPAEGTKKPKADYAGELRAEAHELFDALGLDPKYKRMKKFGVELFEVEPGQPANVPATWHDAVFRYTALKGPDGKIVPGRSGSYDTILSEGQVAGKKQGQIPPGHTLYVLDLGGEGTVAQTRKLRVYRAKGEGPKQVDPITPKAIDYDAGLPEPPIVESSPFRTDRKHTDRMADLYEGREKAIAKDPELATGKLINDVNRFLDGDPLIDIGKVKNTLSDMAARADAMKEHFMGSSEYPFNFTNWKDLISEAAVWARRADRSKIEQTSTPGVVKRPRRKGPSDSQLNTMIPLDQIPGAVVGALSATGRGFRSLVDFIQGADAVKFQDLYRNLDVFMKTGYWLGRDGKWRYEISDRMKIDLQGTHNNLHWENKHPELASYKLPEVYKNDRLYSDVPAMRDVTIRVDPNLKVEGRFDSQANQIILKRKEDRSTFLHELQHAVNRTLPDAFRGTSIGTQKANLIADIYQRLQEHAKDPEIGKMVKDAIKEHEAWLEGRTGGVDLYTGLSNVSTKLMRDPKTNSKALEIRELMFDSLESNLYLEAAGRYIKSPGEMEARLTDRRMSMNEVERRKKPPWEDLDDMLLDENLIGLSDFQRIGDKTFSKTGSTLYDLGGALGHGAAQIIKGAKAAAEYVRHARDLKTFDLGVAATRLREEFNRSFIDRSGNIRIELLDKLGDRGYQVVQKMVLAKGASALAANNLVQMRKEVYRGLNRNERRILDTLILMERMVDIGKYKSNFKFPEAIKPENAIAYLELFQHIEKLSPKQTADLQTRAQAYFEWMKKPLKEMLDAGLISPDEYTALSSHQYRRLKLVDVYDKKARTKVGGKLRTIYDSGIESLAKGRDTDIFEPSSEVMALEVFNRAYGRIMHNRANRDLLNLAKEQPENPFVRIKQGKEDKIPSGWSRIFAYEDGQRKSLYVSPKLAKEWITSNPEISYKFGQLVRWASGNQILKTMATGINWGFALANVPRDVMHLWFASRKFEDGKWTHIYSPTQLHYAGQIGRDMATVFWDAATRGKRYQDYINEGGGMEFLVHQGRLFQRGKKVEKPLDKVFDFLGYLGETSELLTRLAIRERMIRQGKSTQEATFAARDYMDFGQGGSISKAMDNALPYLNASIQGTRGLFRSFKDNWGQSSYMLAQIGALVAGVTIAMHKLSPETFKSLEGSTDAKNNLILPLGDQFSFEDEYGQTRYPYIKIPIDPGQKFFKVFFENATKKWLGYDFNVDDTVDSLKELSPAGADVTELPPTVSAILGYVTNKDFWMNDEIWRKTDKPFSYPDSKEEYIPGQTAQFYKDFGQVTGLSPERTRYAVEELVTGGTIYSFILGKAYEELFGEAPKEVKEAHLAMVLARTPLSRRFIGVTSPYSRHAASIEKAAEESTLERWIETRELDRLARGVLHEGSIKEPEVWKYISSFKDKETQERMESRFEFQRATKDLPERSFWLRLRGLQPEARAKVYLERFNKASDAEKMRLRGEMVQVEAAGGVLTKSFFDALANLRIEEGRNEGLGR